MTRTSQALKRLGVAAIAVATIGAGVPALIATSASASNANNTGVTITPTAETAAIGNGSTPATCNPFTVQVTPADTTTVDIQISQTPATGTATIGFCNPGSGDGGGGVQAQSNGTTTTTTDIGSFIRPTNGQTCAAPTVGNRTTICDAEFNTTAPDAKGANGGQLTFGVFSDTVGSMSVTAFVETANAAGSAAYNTTGNNTPDGTEKTAVATKYLVTNADLAVTSLACTPPTQSAQVGSDVQYSCTAYSTQGSNTKVPVRGANVQALISAGPDRTGGTPPNDARVKCGQPTKTSTGAAGSVAQGTSSGALTNNQGSVTCEFNAGQNTVPGTDTFLNYVEQNSTTPPNGPQSTEPNSSVNVTFFGEGRNIVCSPKTVNATYGLDATVSCKVTDVLGNPVEGTRVDFDASFPGGRFTNNGQFGTSVLTDAAGVATVKINNPDQTTTQTQTVTATIDNAFFSPAPAPNGTFYPKGDNPNAECNQATGKTTSGTATTNTSPAAGNCSDKVTVQYTTNGSPTASPTSTATTPPGTRNNLTLTVNTPDIPAGANATLTGTGSANQQYQLQCYTRPSTTYFTARSGAFNAAGDPVTFTLSLGRNTRCFLQYATNSASGASPSGVVNVHTVLSLSTVRTGVRTYIFQGRNLPRIAGQLITLYRVDRAGNEIRTSNLVTDNSGIYRVTRKFTGTGTFQFKVRTSQTLNNAAGFSNTITVNVH